MIGKTYEIKIGQREKKAYIISLVKHKPKDASFLQKI